LLFVAGFLIPPKKYELTAFARTDFDAFFIGSAYTRDSRSANDNSIHHCLLVEQAGAALISYIVPVYNAGAHLERCIRSIRSQDAGSFEIIVVDNGSTDGAISEIEEDESTRIISESVKGPASARQAGVREARGEYLAFLDADVEIDIGWSRACLEKLSPPWIDCVQTAIVPDAIEGESMRRLREAFISLKTDGTFNYLNRGLAGIPILNSAAFMVKRSVFARGMGFDPVLLRCEDLDFSHQLFFRGCGFATVPESQARVFDERSVLGYLLRSAKTGFYTSVVRKLWGAKGRVSLGKRFSGMGRFWSRPFAFIFIALNQSASMIGEWVGAAKAKADSGHLRAIEEDLRNRFFFRVCIEGELSGLHLSPFVRLLKLDESWVAILLEARPEGFDRIHFEGKNATRFESILRASLESPDDLMVKGLHETELVRDMTRRKFLISGP
jgi:glycosyltransferase involved in cell wall biosynthesis